MVPNSCDWPRRSTLCVITVWRRATMPSVCAAAVCCAGQIRIAMNLGSMPDTLNRSCAFPGAGARNWRHRLGDRPDDIPRRLPSRGYPHSEQAIRVSRRFRPCERSEFAYRSLPSEFSLAQTRLATVHACSSERPVQTRLRTQMLLPKSTGPVIQPIRPVCNLAQYSRLLLRILVAAHLLAEREVAARRQASASPRCHQPRKPQPACGTFPSIGGISLLLRLCSLIDVL